MALSATSTTAAAGTSRARRAFGVLGNVINGSEEKIEFNSKWEEWKTPLFYMLMLSLAGLSFYPAFIPILLILLNRWRKDRYDFVIMLTILLGGYAFVEKEQTGIFLSDIGLVVSAVLWLIFRRPPLLSKILLFILAYFAVMIAIAMTSLESMATQFLTMRMYMAIVFVIVPIASFSGTSFDINVFFRKTIIFATIIAAFYIIDCLIFSGNIMVPNTYIPGDNFSKFYSPYWRPLTFMPFRKYPPGMFMMMLSLYPIAHTYRLRWWQWLVLLGGLFCTFTFTVIMAYVIVYLFLIVKPSKIFKYGLFFILGCVSLYYIDGFLPVQKEDTFDKTSRLRIKSSVDQVLELRKAVDDEDIAQFASGRMAQIIPKFELVAHEGRQALGLGFLHREKTKINRYVITNEYYSDISQNEETATGIEVVAAQIYVTIGYVGLLLHILFFVALYLSIRKLRYAPYVLSVIFACVITGFGGFCGLNSAMGLYLLSLSLAAVLLSNRKEVWGRAWQEPRQHKPNA